MPTYTFLNKETNEVEEHVFKMSEYDEFVMNHPNLERCHIDPVALGDSVRLGFTKPPSAFQRYVIGRMKETIPGNNIHSKFGIPKEY